MLQSHRFDLVVTDQPHEFIPAIREVTNAVILSVQDPWQPNKRILAIEMGADECFPVGHIIPEAEARINSLVRRMAIQRQIDHLRGVVINEDWTFDMRRRVVYARNGVTKLVRPTEARMLMLLLDQRGVTLSRGAIANLMWQDRIRPTERYVDHIVSRLRKIFDVTDLAPIDITTYHGYGYRLNPMK